MDGSAPLPGLPSVAIPRELAPRAGPSAREDPIRAQVVALLAELLRGDSGVTVTPGGQGFVVSGAALVASLLAAIEAAVEGSRTFWATGDGTADVVVSAGAMGSVVVPETTITAPTDGDLIWLWVEIDAGGIVTDAEVRSGSSIPADTETEGHKPLASVSVSGAIATPTPVSWNWTDVEICAGVWRFGGIVS